ncbi:MAG: restriction endonuclease subunit S [Clostridia bacterium]|nr:restriction endonuclease subunit S [Clostridia bacterium]
MQKTFGEVVLFARTGLNPRTNFKLGQGNNKYITIKNIHNNSLIVDDSTDVVDDDALAMIHRRSQIKAGDVLFCSIGRIGDMYIIEEEPVGWDVNESVFVFTLNTAIIRQKYFYYLFKHRDIIEYLTANSSGSTFKSIKMNQLQKMVFDLPSLEEQDKIVSCLDAAADVIDSRQRQLRTLDTLIKARFVEMFGDFKTNPMGWPVVNFEEIAIIDGNMTTDYERYADYPHIGIDSIEKDTGLLKGYRTVAEDGVISGKYIFTPAHIIYSKIRPNLNKVALPDFDGLCSADAYPILPVAGRCNRVFLAYDMRSTFFLDYILQFCNRTNLPKVNRKEVAGFRTPLPPILLQDQFAAFVSQVDKSKVISQFVVEKAA